MNWCTRDGKILGLPSADRPALFEIDGKLHGKDIKAQGELEISGKTISWVGGQKIMHAPKENWAVVYDPEQPTIFNSGCTSIVKEQDNPHGLRMLDKETYFTPQNADVTALAVSAEEDGRLHITDIKEGGGMGLFDGNFILHLPTHLCETLNVKKGDTVTPTMLDGIDLTKVNSALTVGPSVLDYRTREGARDIDMDKSFGQPPPFAEKKRYARTIVLKDSKGIHLRIYDAVPVSTHFIGINPVEVAEHLPDDTDWAFFCDGGQSSILGTRDASGNIDFIGNEHYATMKASAIKERATGNMPSPRSALFGRRRPVPSVVGISYAK